MFCRHMHAPPWLLPGVSVWLVHVHPSSQLHHVGAKQTAHASTKHILNIISYNFVRAMEMP